MGHGSYFSDSPAPSPNHGFLDLAPEPPSSHTAYANSPGGFLFFPLFLVHWYLRTNSLGPGMVLMTHDKALKRCWCLNCNFLFVRGKGPSGHSMPFCWNKQSQGTLKKMRSPYHIPDRETSTVYIFPEMKKGLDRSVSSQSSLGASCCTS